LIGIPHILFIFRLYHELKLTPDEAYKHMMIIIDQMNAALSGLISSDIQDATSDFLIQDQGDSSEKPLDIDSKVIEDLEKKVYFSPEKNNVLFASAYDCWAFDIFSFSKFLGQKLGVNPKVK
jgi:ribosome assembly protein 1